MITQDVRSSITQDVEANETINSGDLSMVTRGDRKSGTNIKVSQAECGTLK